jgi:CheY-like chemotaxis protein
VASHRTILLVDETEWFRDLGTLFLARSGRVLTCGSAEEALELARRERPDMVITDLDMPGRDGADLCVAIRRDPLLAYTPVVVVIGSHRPEDHSRAIRAGATDILTKPLARAALLDSVRRLTGFERPQGRPRIRVAAPVRLDVDGTQRWGTLRNLSRAGAFVELPEPLPGGREVSLSFKIPGSARSIAPTAQVVWSRRAQASAPGAGHGLRFMAVDRHSIEALDEFVSERAPHPATPQP